MDGAEANKTKNALKSLDMFNCAFFEHKICGQWFLKSVRQKGCAQFDIMSFFWKKK